MLQNFTTSIHLEFIIHIAEIYDQGLLLSFIDRMKQYQTYQSFSTSDFVWCVDKGMLELMINVLLSSSQVNTGHLHSTVE